MIDMTEYTRKLSKDEINAMPLRRYEGLVHLVRSHDDFAQALDYLRQEKVLGFDTETKPTFRKGKVNSPALVQLACADRVFLLQLTWMPLPNELAALFSAQGIVKAGVSVHDDMRDLCRLHPFEPAGVVDLGLVARARGISTQGLRNLAANFFGWRISKGMQCSNWSLQELSEGQITYAATDAWVGRLLYLRMAELGLIGGRE
jgi:ribonuclease D